VDIALDRGKTWLHRNDAGDVFVDDTIGKEEPLPKPVAPDASLKADADGDTQMKDEEEQKSSSNAADAAAVPSWITVSNRLHRAQHQLLYKHLYNHLMTEAREWRLASRREQQAKISSQSASHSAAAAGGAAAPTASTATFHPPPAVASSRPWSVTEITPRQISVHIAGSKAGITVNWNRGIGTAFEVTEDVEQEEGEHEKGVGAAIPSHVSRLICNQALTLLLDHTLKNSLSNRPLPENLSNGEGTFHRDPLVTATGLGSSGSNQDDPWPARQVPILQVIVLSVAHQRLVSEVRRAIVKLQQQADETIPKFRIKQAKTTQPHLYAFDVMVGKRSVIRSHSACEIIECDTDILLCCSSSSYVLSATIRGVHFHATVRLPSASPPAVTFAAFGLPQPQSAITPPTDGATTARASHAVVGEMITLTSAQHFREVMLQALTWMR
jgi:hypothetical protein